MGSSIGFYIATVLWSLEDIGSMSFWLTSNIDRSSYGNPIEAGTYHVTTSILWVICVKGMSFGIVEGSRIVNKL